MKIGIITMHRVLNFGSALQAYALQRTLFKLGFDNEIIDYIFPPKESKNTYNSNIVNRVLVFVRNALMGFPTKKKAKKFNYFYKENYILSATQYDKYNIQHAPPCYDVYMTGSDQVWNPKHIKDDINFLLAFAPTGKPRVSYASSFAANYLPAQYVEEYKKYLSEYDTISVRESTGVAIVKQLTGKEATVCCDPTLLLDKGGWDEIENKSDLRLKKKYILVYALYYMFDPYPELLRIIDYVQMKLGMKVIYLNGRKEDAFRRNSIVYKAGGPEDFIRLVKNAEFVITTSFHGVVFSVLYNKPFLGIVKDGNDSDSRITSLLKELHSLKCQVAYDAKINFTLRELLDLKADISNLNALRNNALDYINNSLSK